MAIISRNNTFTNVGTAYRIDGNVSLDAKGDVLNKVGTYIDRVGFTRKSIHSSLEPKQSSKKAIAGWSWSYSRGWTEAFTLGKSAVAINIEDNEFNDVGVIYKGDDKAEISIRRNKMNGVGVVALTSPAGTLLADGKRVIELPLPDKFSQDDLNNLIAIIRKAKNEGGDIDLAVKANPEWAKWLSYGANTASLLSPMIDALKFIII